MSYYAASPDLVRGTSSLLTYPNGKGIGYDYYSAADDALTRVRGGLAVPSHSPLFSTTQAHSEFLESDPVPSLCRPFRVPSPK